MKLLVLRNRDNETLNQMYFGVPDHMNQGGVYELAYAAVDAAHADLRLLTGDSEDLVPSEASVKLTVEHRMKAVGFTEFDDTIKEGPYWDL